MKINEDGPRLEHQATRVIRPLQISLNCAAVLLLAACGSTTPVLDAQFGSALSQAKSAQSLPTTEPLSTDQIRQGAGLPSATESLRGLTVHNTGRTAPAALTAK
jgi:hypothetical protein